jgi:excisionase family DNA binding protein
MNVNDLSLALRASEAAKALGISERHLWQLSKDGKIPHRRVGDGKRVMCLYSVEVLKAWLSQEGTR